MARLILGVMAVTVFSALLLVGCGKDDDDGGSSLVLGTGEAWIGIGESCHNDGDGEVCNSIEIGYIFQQNNDLLIIVNEDGQWYVMVTVKWSTSGNNLIVVGFDEDSNSTYNVSGNTLTLNIGGESHVFTKRSGINPVYPKP
jgi:hypothetical protein